jgi:23S rRNA (cytosine1962-C5)-methyltransferase
MRVLKLKRGAERRTSRGHAWIFSNEIEDFDSSIEPGSDVTVADYQGKPVGSGTFSPKSLISVRLHSRKGNVPLDEGEVFSRIKKAADFRSEWFGEGARSSRLVFAKGDGLPGLVADRFEDTLSVQILTAGMEKRTEAVLEALESLFSPRGILLRNDSAVRELEGLAREVKVARGEVGELVPFTLGGLKLFADLYGGQKTGFFFDQRENYRLLERIAGGAKVLDAFCYSGSWGLNALRYGAKEVTFADISAGALDLVAKNTGANGYENYELIKADVLELLREEETRYDVVVLDPPAYAKNKKSVPAALRGYLNLNKWGLRRVKPGGYLVTCSCSLNVSPDEFTEAVALAASEAGREVRVVGVGRQAADHPWVPAMAETMYLKVLLLKVL